MTAPKRIQLRRTKGWRKPEGAVVVARPTKWGNPFVVGSVRTVGYLETERRVEPADAVRLYRGWLTDPHPTVDVAMLRRSLPDLAGRDLACWCPLDQPCHADVLLEIANRGAQP